MFLQNRTSNSRNVAADNNAKRVNGGDKIAAEFGGLAAVLQFSERLKWKIWKMAVRQLAFAFERWMREEFDSMPQGKSPGGP